MPQGGASGATPTGGQPPSGGTGGTLAAGSGGTAGAVPAAGTGGAAGTAQPTGGAAGSGGTPSLPPRPPWTPPFELGSTGWRQSTSEPCTTEEGRHSPDVWSDAENVYVVAQYSCNSFAGVDCPSGRNGDEGAGLYRNDGSGWEKLGSVTPAELGPAPDEVSGWPWGTVATFGGSSCLVRIPGNAQELDCVDGPFPSIENGMSTGSTFYATSTSDDALIHFDGAAWTTVTPAPGGAFVSSIWATDAFVVTAGGGPPTVVTNGTASPIPGAPVGTYSAVYAEAPDRVYLGNTLGQLVWYVDGQWTSVDTLAADSILAMWGDGQGTVFFITDHRFGKIENEQFQWIAGSDGTSAGQVLFRGIWGNSASEVFLALSETEFEGYECGPTVLLWYDGNELHTF